MDPLHFIGLSAEQWEIVAYVSTSFAMIVAFGAFLTGIFALFWKRKEDKSSHKRYIESMKPFVSFEYLPAYPSSSTVSLKVKNTGKTAAKNIKITSAKISLTPNHEKSLSEKESRRKIDIKSLSILSFDEQDKGKKINYLAPGGQIIFLFLVEEIYQSLVEQEIDEISFFISYSGEFMEEVTEKVDLDIKDSLLGLAEKDVSKEIDFKIKKGLDDYTKKITRGF